MLAAYCRLHIHHFWMKEGRTLSNPKKLKHFHECASRWEGDYWENVPELNKRFKSHPEELKIMTMMNWNQHLSFYDTKNKLCD